MKNIRQIHDQLWQIRGDAGRASNALHNGNSRKVEEQLQSIESRIREIRHQMNTMPGLVKELRSVYD